MMDDYKFKLGLAIAREEELKKKLDALTAYDEAKERELFEAFAMERFLGLTRSEIRDYYYADTQCAWLGWQACAKSRDRSAE